MEGLLIYWILSGFVFGGLTAWLATTKGRSAGGWFLLGFLLNVLAILVVGLAPAVAKPQPPSSLGEKTCPRCAESVKRAAKVCRFCGYEFPEVESALASLSENEYIVESSENPGAATGDRLILTEGNGGRFQVLKPLGGGQVMLLDQVDGAQVTQTDRGIMLVGVSGKRMSLLGSVAAAPEETAPEDPVTAT